MVPLNEVVYVKTVFPEAAYHVTRTAPSTILRPLPRSLEQRSGPTLLDHAVPRTANYCGRENEITKLSNQTLSFECFLFVFFPLTLDIEAVRSSICTTLLISVQPSVGVVCG